MLKLSGSYDLATDKRSQVVTLVCDHARMNHLSGESLFKRSTLYNGFAQSHGAC